MKQTPRTFGKWPEVDSEIRALWEQINQQMQDELDALPKTHDNKVAISAVDRIFNRYFGAFEHGLRRLKRRLRKLYPGNDQVLDREFDPLIALLQRRAADWVRPH